MVWWIESLCDVNTSSYPLTELILDFALSGGIHSTLIACPHLITSEVTIIGRDGTLETPINIKHTYQLVIEVTRIQCERGGLFFILLHV